MKSFLVGGAVRDTLLGYPFHEKDWVVVGATPAEMIEAERRFFVHAGQDPPFEKKGGFEALSLMDMLRTIAED